MNLSTQSSCQAEEVLKAQQTGLQFINQWTPTTGNEAECLLSIIDPTLLQQVTAQSGSRVNELVLEGTGVRGWEGTSNALTRNANSSSIFPVIGNNSPQYYYLDTAPHPLSTSINHHLQNCPNPDIPASKIANPELIASNSDHSLGSTSYSPPTAPSFRCRWQGCTSTANFRRVGDLMRHIKAIHIAPAAFPCLAEKCGKAFGRRDHLLEHTRRCHPVD